MSNINKVKLLSERTFEIPPVIFLPVVPDATVGLCVGNGCPVIEPAIIRIRAVVLFQGLFFTVFSKLCNVTKKNQFGWWLIPATALQLTLQPLLVEQQFVVNTRLMVLVLLVMAGGKEEPI